MNTEEDTFRILSRPSFTEINQLYLKLLFDRQNHLVWRHVVEFFDEHKWGVDEFYNERQKETNKTNH
jgi:hypothetical protein